MFKNIFSRHNKNWGAQKCGGIPARGYGPGSFYENVER